MGGIFWCGVTSGGMRVGWVCGSGMAGVWYGVGSGRIKVGWVCGHGITNACSLVFDRKKFWLL